MRLGLSQSELARRMADQTTPATISRWEGGRFGPDRARLDRLVRILGVSVSSLLDERSETKVFADAALVEAERDALKADNDRLRLAYDRMRLALAAALDASEAPKRPT